MQLAVLAALVHLAGMHYAPATVIAVEAALLHNFLWHQRWTWRDRPSRSPRETATRLLRFHLTNGAISMLGNVALMACLTGAFRLDPIVANGVAIAVCSLVNFAASESVVFSPRPVMPGDPMRLSASGRS